MTRTRSSAAEAPAYLTLFLTLSLTIILSLILTLVEGARIYAIRMQAECVTRTAMDSCLAEYNRALQERYDLFYVDTSYGTGAGSEADLAEHFKSYIGKNLGRSDFAQMLGARDLTALSVADYDVVESRYACDGGMASVREQIQAYMTAGPESAVLEGVLSAYESVMEYDGDDWEEAYNESTEAFDEALEEALEDDEDEEDGESHHSHGESREQLSVLSEILDEIREVLGRAALAQVFGGGGNVSDASAAGENLLSSRSLHYGTGYDPENSHDYDEVGSLLMGQYILEKCGNYTETLEGSHLQYEVEYILFGESDDRENLERMTARLLLLRAAADMYAIRNVDSCTGTADAIAALLQIFPGIPAEITRELVLTIWAYAEAIRDVRTLYAGGKVPLHKTDANWQTSFSRLFSSGGGSSGGSGIGYAAYLRAFLLAQDLMDPDTTTERLLDIMELDVAVAQDGIPIFMDYCLDAMYVDVQYSSGFGYSCEVRQGITYD